MTGDWKNLSVIRSIPPKFFAEKLLEKGVRLITKGRKNTKKVDRTALENWLLRKRAVIESVIDQLKNVSQIEYSRHRKLINFLPI